MRNIPVKVNGDSVQDYEWNPAQSELENIVTDTGQTLNPSDNYQVSKAAAVYAGSGDFYIDTGTVNSYLLTPIGSKETPIAYIDGLRVRFIPANNNTGTTTIAISGLSTKSLKKGILNGVLSNLQIGDLSSSYLTEAFFIAALDCFILSPASFTQINNISQIPPGLVSPMIYTQANTPAGWVIMNDGTIGNTTSGATTRANLDCMNLFLALWNNVSNTWAPVSGGRGVDALSDWSANKTIKLLTSTGKVIANQMGAIGQGFGTSTASLSATNNGWHNHPYAVPIVPTDTHGAGSSLNICNGQSNQITGSSGDGTPFSIVQPTLSLNYFMKL